MLNVCIQQNTHKLKSTFDAFVLYKKIQISEKNKEKKNQIFDAVNALVAGGVSLTSLDMSLHLAVLCLYCAGLVI